MDRSNYIVGRHDVKRKNKEFKRRMQEVRVKKMVKKLRKLTK